MIICFCIAMASVVVWMAYSIYDIKRQSIKREILYGKNQKALPEPFSIPEYLDRIEQVHLQLLQEREQNPISRVIELWWGLDGLRLNEDGTMEWIKREPVKESLKEKKSLKELKAQAQAGIFLNSALDKYQKTDIHTCDGRMLDILRSDIAFAHRIYAKQGNDILHGEAQSAIAAIDKEQERRKEQKAKASKIHGTDTDMSKAQQAQTQLFINSMNSMYPYSMPGFTQNFRYGYNPYLYAPQYQYPYPQQSCNLQAQINYGMAQQIQGTDASIRAMQNQIAQSMVNVPMPGYIETTTLGDLYPTYCNGGKK